MSAQGDVNAQGDVSAPCTRLVAVSDTHGKFRELSDPGSALHLPAGDILVHAGDLTKDGSHAEVQVACDWLAGLRGRYQHIILVPGNHDRVFQKDAPLAREMVAGRFDLLIDQGVRRLGLDFWGTPWTPAFGNLAFGYEPRNERWAENWDAGMPEQIDVLISHGPPLGILDRLERTGKSGGSALLRAAIEKRRVRLVVCGHIHEGYGLREEGGVQFVNASLQDTWGEVRNPPVVIDLPR